MSQLNLPQLDIAPIFQLGVAGLMLWWFMVRVERKLDLHTNVINDLALSITLDVLSRDNVHPGTKSRADELLKRMSDRKTHFQAILGAKDSFNT